MENDHYSTFVFPNTNVSKSALLTRHTIFHVMEGKKSKKLFSLGFLYLEKSAWFIFWPYWYAILDRLYSIQKWLRVSSYLFKFFVVKILNYTPIGTWLQRIEISHRLIELVSKLVVVLHRWRYTRYDIGDSSLKEFTQ